MDISSANAMNSERRDRVAQQIRNSALANNWALAEEVAEAENEQQALGHAPGVLVVFDRAIALVVPMIGEDEVLQVVVNSTCDIRSVRSLLIVTTRAVLQAELSRHAEDRSAVTIVPRSALQRLHVSATYEDRSSDDPEYRPVLTTVLATYEGGLEVQYEEGPDNSVSAAELVARLSQNVR